MLRSIKRHSRNEVATHGAHPRNRELCVVCDLDDPISKLAECERMQHPVEILSVDGADAALHLTMTARSARSELYCKADMCSKSSKADMCVCVCGRQVQPKDIPQKYGVPPHRNRCRRNRPQTRFITESHHEYHASTAVKMVLGAYSRCISCTCNKDEKSAAFCGPTNIAARTILGKSMF